MKKCPIILRHLVSLDWSTIVVGVMISFTTLLSVVPLEGAKFYWHINRYGVLFLLFEVGWIYFHHAIVRILRPNIWLKLFLLTIWICIGPIAAFTVVGVLSYPFR